MSTNICCAPCRRADTTTTENLNWCAECAELICKQCATFHSRFKTTCKHKMVAVTREKAAEILSTVIDQNCKDHPEEVVSFLCQDHDTLCCNICIITKHSHCKGKTSTDEIGKDLKDGSTPLDLTPWIGALEEKCRFLEFGLDCARKQLELGELAISRDIKDIRNQINASIDKLEQTMLAEFHSKSDKIESQLDLDADVLNKTHGEVKKIDTAIVVSREFATNTQYLMAARIAAGKRKELEAQVNEMMDRCRIIKLGWTLEPLISDIETLVTKQIDIIKTNETPFSKAVQSSTVVIEKEKKTSWFVNVEILDDGRVLLLDQTHACLRLLDMNMKQLCILKVKDAKQFAAVSKILIVVCLNDESKLLKVFKLSDTQITTHGEVNIDSNCIGISKYQTSAVLLCSNEKNGLHVGDIVFRLLKENKSIAEFSFPKMDKISPWRGFVYDDCLGSFVAISVDGSSLMWLNKTGQVIKEKRLENTGRGGLSGLAVDKRGRVYAASTRKVFEITRAGDISGTFEASINVYSIAVNTNGDKLIAVGHNNAIEVFTLNRLDY